jgi:hypothetical protein
MRRGYLAALAILLAAGCATARRGAPSGAPPEAVAYPPSELTVTPLDLELAGKNDEELFAIGTAALEAKDFRRAAAALGRVADLHPGSRHEGAALLGAGLALEGLEEWRPALERFRAAEQRAGGRDAVEAAFRAAECDWHLGDLDAAHGTLDALARRDDLPAADRIRALAQRGVVELAAGRPEDAERTLRAAVAAWQDAGARERIDAEYAAQAQFYLGEVYRAGFEAIKLDLAADEARLARDLEEKAERLLSAQGHYLRTIRMGVADWAVAAGARIGELYDTLHAEIVAAPLPPGLDEAHAAAYRTELRRRARVLVTKAIEAYEETLAAAQRTGVDGRIVDEAHASLERMKRMLEAD